MCLRHLEIILPRKWNLDVCGGKEEYVDLDVAHMSWHKDIMEAMSTRDFQKAEKMLEESFNMMEKSA